MAAAKSTRRKLKDDPDPSMELLDRIEAERRQMQKACAVLTALVYSLSQGLDSEQASDAASVALDLVEQAIGKLDAVELTGRLEERNRR